MSEPRTKTGQRFDLQWPGGTRIGRDQWRGYILAIEAEAERSAEAAPLRVRYCNGCDHRASAHDVLGCVYCRCARLPKETDR